MSNGGLFAWVSALVLVSRLPFLGPGYGTDPDAWRVAWSARTLAATGRYEASRFPGNPVQEIASSLLLRLGPWAPTLATAVMSALAAGLFALIFRRLGARTGTAALAAVALASTPAVYLASVQAMDYAWALAFALAALRLALDGRAAAAGIAAGLAIGCRMTSAIWLVPVGIALADASPPGTRARRALAGAAVALGVGALAYAPVVAAHGPGFFRFYQTGYPGALVLAKLLTVDVWGLLGTAALGLTLVSAIVIRRRCPPEVALPGLTPRLGNGVLVALALFLAAFLRLPIKGSYLIPAVPIALLLAGRALDPRVFAALAVALALSPWALKVAQVGRPDEPVFAGPRLELPLPGPYALDVLHGAVPTDHARRIARTRYVDRTIALARALERESVVVAWDWLPELRVRLGGKDLGRARFVYLLSHDELGDLCARGVDVYTLAYADAQNRLVHGYGLEAEGARPLDPAGREGPPATRLRPRP